jgi:hypothetical protein
VLSSAADRKPPFAGSSRQFLSYSLLGAARWMERVSEPSSMNLSWWRPLSRAYRENWE